MNKHVVVIVNDETNETLTFVHFQRGLFNNETFGLVPKVLVYPYIENGNSANFISNEQFEQLKNEIVGYQQVEEMNEVEFNGE